MNKVLYKIPDLVKEELEASNAAHPAFSSQHEGYAVLLEEVEEAREEMFMVNDRLEALWGNVKMDYEYLAEANAKEIEDYAMRLAAEAVQVAAMARKFRGVQSIDPAEETRQERPGALTGGRAE